MCRSGSRTGVDWTGGIRQRAGLELRSQATISLHLRSHDAFTGGGPYMSGWQELRAERNRRSVLRLTKALPLVFPRAVLPVLLPVPSCHRRRGLQSSRTGAPIQFAPIAWREHLQLAAKRPVAGLGGSGTAGAACLSRSVRHPRRTAKPHTHSVRDLLRVRSTSLSPRLAR